MYFTQHSMCGWMSRYSILYPRITPLLHFDRYGKSKALSGYPPIHKLLLFVRPVGDFASVTCVSQSWSAPSRRAGWGRLTIPIGKVCLFILFVCIFSVIWCLYMWRLFIAVEKIFALITAGSAVALLYHHRWSISTFNSRSWCIVPKVGEIIYFP